MEIYGCPARESVDTVWHTSTLETQKTQCVDLYLAYITSPIRKHFVWCMRVWCCEAWSGESFTKVKLY